MTVTDDDGNTIEVREPRARRMIRYLAGRQDKLARYAAGELELHFGDARQRLHVKWTELESER